VVGVAPFVLGECQASAVLRTAHSASRDAREAEQSVGLYSAASDAVHQRRFDLIAHFRQALQTATGLHLAYQPRVHLASGHCVGAEALIRWQHASLGAISPAEFIPLVENTQMARGLTDWVMRQAIRQAAHWHRQGFDLRISVNVAANNLEEEDFTDRLLSYLKQEALPLSGIELELTESGLIRNGRIANQQLQALMDAGVKIAIDDFGTGYSSLDYLQKIPAHTVKIDRSFVAGLEGHRRGQTLVKSMISMAHDLGYSVVAEGVETWACYELLQALGCDEVQGYLLAKPLSTDDFERWLRSRLKG